MVPNFVFFNSSSMDRFGMAPAPPLILRMTCPLMGRRASSEGTQSHSRSTLTRTARLTCPSWRLRKCTPPTTSLSTFTSHRMGAGRITQTMRGTDLVLRLESRMTVRSIHVASSVVVVVDAFATANHAEPTILGLTMIRAASRIRECAARG